ncbi:MAG: hypothetical protein P8Y97_10330 [Candidatus Lokiarchaeota archaeon]
MDSLPEVRGIPEEYFLEIDGFLGEGLDDLTREYLRVLYPEKAIKRILFKPYLGKWYPYIDSWSPNSDLQLSLFYGPVNITLSREKQCLACRAKLNSKEKENNLKNKGGSILKEIALCEECQKRMHFNYFTCLIKILQNSINFSELRNKAITTNENNNSSKDSLKNNKVQVCCENLLSPACGFPMNSENTNPCLLNHGIGITVNNQTSITILIAPLSKLKYYMIRKGGLLGVIFGYSNRIINLDTLEKELEHILNQITNRLHLIFKSRHLKEEIEEIQLSFPQINKRIQFKKNFQDFKTQTLSNLQYTSNKSNTSNLSIFWMFLINFLHYYQSYQINSYINKILQIPVKILKQLIIELTKNTNLEILDFCKLYEMIIPYSSDFRNYLEKEVINVFERPSEAEAEFLANLNNFLRSHSEKDVFQKFSTVFNKIPNLNLDQISDSEIQIQNVMGCLGSNLLVKTSLREDPQIINVEELIGRSFR